MARRRLYNRWLAQPVSSPRMRHRTSHQVSRSIKVPSHRSRRQASETVPTRPLVVRRSEAVATLVSTNHRLVGSHLPSNNNNNNNNNINSKWLKMRNTTSHSPWIQARERAHILTLSSNLSTPPSPIPSLPHREKRHEETMHQRVCLRAPSSVDVVPRSPGSSTH